MVTPGSARSKIILTKKMGWLKEELEMLLKKGKKRKSHLSLNLNLNVTHDSVPFYTNISKSNNTFLKVKINKVPISQNVHH